MTSKRSQSHSSPKLLRHTARYGLASLLLGGTVVGTGCLDRPIEPSTPTTTNVVVQKQANNAITGIDLLLMIDNSSSMADKQAILAAAVPQLLGQLVAPNCVDAIGNPATPACGSNSWALATLVRQRGLDIRLRFNPVNNIHIGIVTSSLGDHGANSLCTPGAPTQYTDANGNAIPQPPDVNDEGHLIGTLARAQTAPTDILTDPQSQYATLPTDSSSNLYGFLAWGNSTLPTDVSQQDLTDANKIFIGHGERNARNRLRLRIAAGRLVPLLDRSCAAHFPISCLRIPIPIKPTVSAATTRSCSSARRFCGPILSWRLSC